jgi:hypothetical protein
MFRRLCTTAAALLVSAGAIATLHADPQQLTLAIVMTNDQTKNAIQVYDASTRALLQTVPTSGQGGAGGNARGVRQLDGELFAAVNAGSNTVGIFRRNGNLLSLEQLLPTSSAPESLDFGNDHLYVAGAQTIDSFDLKNHRVGIRDGSAQLQLVGNTVPPDGSTAQVGVIDARHVLVTLKTDPTPGTVDVVGLDENGAVLAALEHVVSAPAGTLTPFGFAPYGDGTAVITLAHSSQDGLFRDGAFVTTIAAGQAAPCWMTRAGKYVFTANTGSKTISRLVGTGSNIFVDAAVAAPVVTGGAPSDIDSNQGVLGVIDHTADQSHLSLFTYSATGELTAIGAPITLGVANANGVAIMAPVAQQ